MKDNETIKGKGKHHGIVSCSSTDDDDESVTCRWSDVSEDSVWDIVDDDCDEQEILQVDGSDCGAHDSEMEIDMGRDSCAAEFVIPLGLVCATE